MWTSTMELSLRRVIPTQLIGRFWRGAYFSSFAPLQVQNIPRQPLPSPNWVRVRNRLAGICGSDLHLIYTDGDFRIAPAALPNHEYSYPGHEVVGEVIEYPFGGGWSEEMLLHEQQLFRIPPEMNDEQAVLLEPTAVAVHAVLRRLPRPGDRVLVIGAGTIGLLLLQVIHALVPQAETSVAARYPFQVEQATRLGAAHILYPQDGYQAVQRATGAQLYQGPMGNQMLLGGYDVIYDTIGKERTIHEALRWTRAGGAVVVVGVSLHLMHLDLTPVWYQEVDLIGTLAHGTETWPVGTQSRCSTFAIATELILRGQLNPAQLITHHFPLSEYQRALTTATDKADCRAIKVVFDYSLQPASVVPNVRTSSQRRLQTPALSDIPEPTVSGDTPGADVTEATDDKTVIVVKPPKRYPLKPGDRTVNG